MWTAYYQADGEMRHTIAVTKFKWTAEHEAEKFVERMTNPEAQLFWTWVEGNDETTGEENNEKHITEAKSICQWPHDANTVECICGWKNPAKELVDVVKQIAGPYVGHGPWSPFSF